MSAAQCKAARRKMKNDPRYQPKKGLRGGFGKSMTPGMRKAMARNRKMVAAGKGAGSIGGNSKGR